MLIKWLKTHCLYTIKKCMSNCEKGKVIVDQPLSVWYQNPQQVSQVSHASIAYVLACAGIGMSQIGFACPSSVTTVYKAFNRWDRIFTMFAKKENI